MAIKRTAEQRSCVERLQNGAGSVCSEMICNGDKK